MSHRDVIRRTTAVGALIGTLLVGGCSDEKTPVRLGLIGGISGGNADVGQAGRNGAMLAVEEINRAGGILGRPVELLIRDDANAPDKAVTAARDLISEKVAAIVGPFTSSMSQAVRSVTEPAGMLVFSPTAASDAFSGLDDHFFRLGTSNGESAMAYAKFLIERRNIRRLSLALDKTNPMFAGRFLEAFGKEFRALGGEIVVDAWEDFHTLVGFDDLVARLRGPRPDALLLMTNAVDAARIAQQFRKVDAATRILVSEWAATQQLIELGGQAVEGVELLRSVDGFSREARYLRFVGDYVRRFNLEPSDISVLAYEVVGVLARALEKRKDGESVKQAILANRPYQGLQQTLEIDSTGDTHRKTHFVVVKNAAFAPAP